MHLAHTVARLRRRSAFLGLGVLLIATALSLTQCRMVGERLTGVDLECARPDKCISACQQVFNGLMAAEADQHVLLVKQCNGDPVCLATEEIRHEQAVSRIQMGRQECVNRCHHQGGGHGGR